MRTGNLKRGAFGLLALGLSACLWGGHDCRSCMGIVYKGYLHNRVEFGTGDETKRVPMDTLIDVPRSYTVSTVYPGENPESLVGYPIGTTCGCIPSSVQIHLEGGVRYDDQEFANQNINVNSIRRIISIFPDRTDQLVFKDSVLFKSGINRFLLEAVTPDGRTVQDTFAFFVPDTLGYRE